MTALKPAVPATVPLRGGATPDLDAIRADLEAQRRFRVEQLTDLAATVTSTGSDGARDEVAATLKAAAFTVLVEIDAALHRIELDCYGRCQRCGRAIPPDRLEALPMATLCMPCQYAKEASGADRMRQSDVVDQWGDASFPASDPPQNW